MNSEPLSRREFLKASALGFGGLSLASFSRFNTLPEFPNYERLGRVVCLSGLSCNIELKARPDPDSQTVKTVYDDTVLPWLHELAGNKPSYVFSNQRWVETPDGFIYGPYLQPVVNAPNTPVANLPVTSLGPGMWVEVTVPYADVALVNEPSSNSWVKIRSDLGLPLRVYYSQIFWVDQIKKDAQGRIFYRVNPNYYGGVDMFWTPAEAMRPITAEEMAPIHPEAERKRVEVDVTHQTVSCYEGNQEVYFCRVSTGAKYDMYGNVVDNWATPVGLHRVTRKFVSLQMAGGTTGAGYDLPGIGWTTIFATGGVAIHSTFWHNTYGDPVSHGCVNAAPQDAKWIFRWTQPTPPADPGALDVSLTGEASTQVEVREG
jgi:lipoprotein-anchoring transpeptidase ErfK/SrfK